MPTHKISDRPGQATSFDKPKRRYPLHAQAVDTSTNIPVMRLKHNFFSGAPEPIDQTYGAELGGRKRFISHYLSAVHTSWRCCRLVRSQA